MLQWSRDDDVAQYHLLLCRCHHVRLCVYCPHVLVRARLVNPVHCRAFVTWKNDCEVCSRCFSLFISFAPGCARVYECVIARVRLFVCVCKFAMWHCLVQAEFPRTTILPVLLYTMDVVTWQTFNTLCTMWY